MYDDLDALLHGYADLILVNLWDSRCEASLYMEQLMYECERHLSVPILRLKLTEYRDWAGAHGIYGTPALVAYYRGRPVFRLIGRVTPSELLQRLHSFGL
jgi:hypothetical protein